MREGGRRRPRPRHASGSVRFSRDARSNAANYSPRGSTACAHGSPRHLDHRPAPERASPAHGTREVPTDVHRAAPAACFAGVRARPRNGDEQRSRSAAKSRDDVVQRGRPASLVHGPHLLPSGLGCKGPWLLDHRRSSTSSAHGSPRRCPTDGVVSRYGASYAAAAAGRLTASALRTNRAVSRPLVLALHRRRRAWSPRRYASLQDRAGSLQKGSHNVPLRYRLAMKKQTKQLKTLRLRKEALKVLTTEQQLRVHAGSDPWDHSGVLCDPGPGA